MIDSESLESQSRLVLYRLAVALGDTDTVEKLESGMSVAGLAKWVECKRHMITRESFLAGHVCKPEPVENAWVRPMTAGEKDRWEAVHLKAPEQDFRARLVVACLCDEAGRLVFTEEDIPALSELPSYVLDPFCTAAARVNKMGPEETEALRKNSPGPNGDSSSSLLATSAE